MKGKTVSLIVIGILISFLIVGCGTKKGSEGNLKEELSLSVITTFAGEDGNAQRYKGAISAFEEETGVKINDSSATSDETFKARIKTDFQVGSEPDVLFFFSGADANSFIEEGKVVSIDTIRKEYPDYAGNMEDDFLVPSLVDGKKYTVPVNGYWEAMFCNQEVMDAAGVEVPGPDYTWDEFLDDCEKI